MTKKDLAKTIAEVAGLSQVRAQEAVQLVFEGLSRP
jgi:nucleoid DNA-binding protein